MIKSIKNTLFSQAIHDHLKTNPKIALSIEEVTENCIFFAGKKHVPKSFFTKLLWESWAQLELRGEKLLGLADIIFQGLPTSTHEKWLKLRSYRYNSNSLAKKALALGASFVVVDEGKFEDKRIIKVGNVRQSLFQLAREHRLRSNAIVVGITGSCGKTTTKEFLAHILAKKYNVVATTASFNTFEGVCHTLFRINADTEVVIVEISSDGEDVVGKKAFIASPDIGIITQIGKAHLEGFGSVEGVRQVKKKLFDEVKIKNGLLIVNQDDPDIVSLAGDYPRVRRFGSTIDVDVYGKSVENIMPLELWWRAKSKQDYKICTHVFGKYNISNILSAITVAIELNVEPQLINEAISSYMPENMRSQIFPFADGFLILDAYNANPTSVHAALEDFRNTPSSHQTLIIGDMLELGQASYSEHLNVLNLIESMSIDIVYFVGPIFKEVIENNKNLNIVCRSFLNVDELSEYLKINELVPCSTILIKGSRGMALEQVLRVLPLTN